MDTLGREDRGRRYRRVQPVRPLVRGDDGIEGCHVQTIDSLKTFLFCIIGRRNVLRADKIETDTAPNLHQGSVNADNLLLVEDNEMNIEIFQRALRKSRLSYPITVVAHDGVEALSI